MKELCNKMVECFTDQIKADLSCGVNLDAILNAYNRFQEDERDGVDYIFDIENTKDLIPCVEGGMTSKEIVELVLLEHQTGITKFFFGVNHPKPEPLGKDQVIDTLKGYAEDIACAVVKYCCRCDEYSALYEEYVTNTLEN